VQKRSLTIAGHRTSIALEPEFWAALEDLARVRQLSPSTLIEAIDRERSSANLSSAIRVELLQFAREGGGQSSNSSEEA
jgi:predicted DNA-binding ribbon-helix-helix protein